MQADVKLPDPDLALTDPTKYQEQLTNYLQVTQAQQIAAYAQPMFNQLAGTARELSKQDPANKDIWSKWGGEIEQMVSNVPAHLRTRELYDQAVVMVKGRHVDEIATERAERLAAANPGLARAGGAEAEADADSGSADVWAKIESSPMGAAALKVAGKRGIMAAVRAGAYKSLEDYAAAATKSKAKVDPSNPNVIRDYVRK